MAASSSRSSHHHAMKFAVESLHSFLTHYGRLEVADRSNFINKFQDVFMQPTNEHHPYEVDDSITTTGDAHFDPLAIRFSKLVDTLNSCWVVSQPEPNPTPSSSLQQSPPEWLLQHLLCFSLLGNNEYDDAIVTRRQLIYWWVAQGLIDVEDGQDAEKEADNTLRELVDAGAIGQVTDKSKQRKTTKYRLISKLSDQFMMDEQHKVVGMLKKEGANLKLIPIRHRHPIGPTTIDGDKQLALIETLYNPDVSILNIRRDWLQKMRSLKVLHLGRWSSDKELHMEVETVEFLQAFKHLKKVKYISLRGLSRIMELGEEICSLGNSLRVLDLRDCSNLEMLPKGIGRLKNLTHLDLSECFLLDRIPKGIVALTKLQVLKGFVITDVQTSSSCKFKDLASHLGKTLIKLSIRTRKMRFPVEEEDDLKAFSQFEKLLKLKVEWVRITSDSADEQKKQVQQIMEPVKPSHTRSFKRSIGMMSSIRHRGANDLLPGLPEQLEKLEVHDIPQAAVQSLMLRNDHKLQKNLIKLYIIGGEVSDLVAQGELQWEGVETLRLKYLAKLHMSWMQLEVSFPKVNYIEAVHCPFLSFLPCDPNGIWKRRQDV